MQTAMPPASPSLSGEVMFVFAVSVCAVSTLCARQIIYNMQTIINLLTNLNMEDLVRSILVKTNDMHLVRTRSRRSDVGSAAEAERYVRSGRRAACICCVVVRLHRMTVFSWRSASHGTTPPGDLHFFHHPQHYRFARSREQQAEVRRPIGASRRL